MLVLLQVADQLAGAPRLTAPAAPFPLPDLFVQVAEATPLAESTAILAITPSTAFVHLLDFTLGHL